MLMCPIGTGFAGGDDGGRQMSTPSKASCSTLINSSASFWDRGHFRRLVLIVWMVGSLRSFWRKALSVSVFSGARYRRRVDLKGRRPLFGTEDIVVSKEYCAK